MRKIRKTLSHELLHALFDSIGFHDELVDRLKVRIYEKMVDGLAHQLVPFLCPKLFKVPHHLAQIKQKTRS